MKEYLIGVVAAEMPASFPDEALKAQAAAARTYTVYKMRLLELGAANPDEHMGAVVCDDYHHCKAFADAEKRRAMWGEDYERYEAVIENAVTDTDGMIVKYNGEPIAAVFHCIRSAHGECSRRVGNGNAVSEKRAGAGRLRFSKLSCVGGGGRL